MKKEVILAILIGLGMGLFITYGVYRVKSAVADKPTTDLETAIDPTPATTNTPALIAIHNPEHGSIQTEKATTVTGTTTQNSHVVLFVNNTDYISTSDETGNFTFEVDLTTGANYLITHVIDTSGSGAIDERVIIVSSALEELETLENAPEASGEAETTTDEETIKDQEEEV